MKAKPNMKLPKSMTHVERKYYGFALGWGCGSGVGHCLACMRPGMQKKIALTTVIVSLFSFKLFLFK